MGKEEAETVLTIFFFLNGLLTRPFIGMCSDYPDRRKV
jgi:hypothetical protein